MSDTSSRWEPGRNPIHRLIQCLDVLSIALNRFHQCSFRLPSQQEGRQCDPDGSTGWFEGRARLLKDFEAVRDAVCTLEQSEAVGGFGQLLFDEAAGAFTRFGAFDEPTRTTVGEAAEWVNQVVRSPISGVGPTARPWDYYSTQPVRPGHPRPGERFELERGAVRDAIRLRTTLISALVQAGGHVPGEVRARKPLFSHNWQQADPVTQDELINMARATNRSDDGGRAPTHEPVPHSAGPPSDGGEGTGDDRPSGTRPARPTLSERVEAQVSQLKTVPPPGLDSELGAVYTAVTVAVRECARLQATLPALWTDAAEYRRLAAIVHDAADAARAAYDRVDVRLRRAGGRNVVLDVLNDVLTVRGRVPLDPLTQPGGLNGIVTRLFSTAGGLFADVDGRGIFDRMLDQLAHVPPVGGVSAIAPHPPSDAPSAEQFGHAAGLIVLARETWRWKAHRPVRGGADEAHALNARMPAAEREAMRVVPFGTAGYDEWERRVKALRTAFAELLRCGDHGPDLTTRLDALSAAMLDLERAAVAACGRPVADTPATGSGASTAGADSRQAVGPPPPRRTKIKRAEAEILVAEWLLKNAKENPAAVTRDAVVAGTGVSAGQVSATAAWKAFSKRRDAEANPVPRDIPLTDQMTATIPAGHVGKAKSVQKNAILDELIREQEADQAEDDRRHKRRHDPS